MTNSIPALDQLVSVQYYLHGPNTEEGYEENRVFQKGRGVGLGGVILNGLKARSDPATPKVLGQYKEVVVQPIPAGKSSDVLEAFLSEARSKRSAENIKTLRSIRLGQQIFHMNPREATRTSESLELVSISRLAIWSRLVSISKLRLRDFKIYFIFLQDF